MLIYKPETYIYIYICFCRVREEICKNAFILLFLSIRTQKHENNRKGMMIVDLHGLQIFFIV